MSREQDGDLAASGEANARRRAEAVLAPPSRDDIVPHQAYRTIVESVVDYAIVAFDPSGRIFVWNDAAAEVFGLPANEMIGRPIDDIFTPEDRAAGRPEEEMRLARENGRAGDDRWHLKGDGTRFFARGQMMPLQDEDGRQTGFLKILRDRTQEERARLELASSRERLHFALDASALVGTWDWDVAADRIYADSRFASLYGIDPDLAAQGLPIAAYFEGVHPDDQAVAKTRIQEALAAGSVFAHEYRTIDRDGKVHWLYSRGRCFHDENGQPTRFPGAVVDMTREKLRDERQSALLALGDDGSEFGEPFDYTLRALQILGETLRIDRVGYGSVDADEAFITIVGEWTRADVQKLSGRLTIASYGSALIEGIRPGLMVVDDVRTHPKTMDGVDAWNAIGVRSMVTMAVVENGRVQVILYLHAAEPRHWIEDELAFVREVLNRAWAFSRRRQSEQSLMEAETRLRLAHEAAEIGSFDYDLRTGDLVWDKRCRAAFGVSDDGSISYKTAFVEQLHPDDRNRVLTETERVMGDGGDGVLDIVYRTIGRDDGLLRYVHANGQTVVEDGSVVRLVGAVRDVTEEKEAEERQILLTRELQHRVKNTLAMVNALANQTMRRAANAQEGLAAFSSRLIALSHAHDILTQTSWTSAPIDAVVSQSVASHQGGEAERVVWSGPDVRLTAKQSLALALALHELATNAVKYGALSNEEGQVRIGWHLALSQGVRTLHFEWIERGGPPVVVPTTRGFGSRLIEQSLSLEFGGEVVVTYAPEGLVCTIDADLQLNPDEDAILPLRLDDPKTAL